MKFHQLFLNLCVAVLVLCGTAAAQTLATSVEGDAAGEPGNKLLCGWGLTPKAESKCSGSYTFLDGNQDMLFTATLSANASFGAMTDASYSAIYNYGAKTIGANNSTASSEAASDDRLYIYGLKAGEVAYLRGFFSVNGSPVGSISSFSYRIYLMTSPWVSWVSCVVNNDNPPHCSLRLRITYSSGRPAPINLQRYLTVNAISALAAGAPNGAYVVTGVKETAYANLNVVDSEGHIITGVTIIGSSGHIYN
jgi:hypothetical protein